MVILNFIMAYNTVNIYNCSFHMAILMYEFWLLHHEIFGQHIELFFDYTFYELQYSLFYFTDFICQSPSFK